MKSKEMTQQRKDKTTGEENRTYNGIRPKWNENKTIEERDLRTQ